MVFDYAASVINQYTAGYPTWLVVSASAGVVLLSWLLADMGIFSKSKFVVKDKHCYIGGGSEGLGLSLACQLADRGAHVSIVSRSQAKLDKALAQIETHRISPSQKFAAYPCDLTSAPDAAATLHKACAPFGAAPDFIFACAGGSVPMMWLDSDVDSIFRIMEWNYKTALCTVHEGVKRMRDEGKEGKVVLTASVMAMMGFAGYASYSPSKFAIRGLADALRNELLLYGISVHLFLPATIFTPGFEQEMKTKPQLCKTIEGPDEGMGPDQVAAHMIKGLERNDFYITYEPVGHMLRNSRGIVPRNNLLLDTFWGIAGTVAFPFWRMFAADGEVLKERKRLAQAKKAK